MVKLTADGGSRKPRIDGQRNRERIVEAAREAFSERGPEATLEEIARRAEVGAGTLYRHFPTRESLIEQVFRTHVEKLTAAGQRYASTMPALEALRAWMLLFIEYVADKLLIIPALETLPGGSTGLIEGSRGVIFDTFRRLVRDAIASGSLHAETDPDDLIRALVGIFYTTAMPGWEASARRLVDVLLNGLRAGN